MQTLRVNNSRILRVKNAKFSGWYFYMIMNTKEEKRDWFSDVFRGYRKIPMAWNG